MPRSSVIGYDVQFVSLLLRYVKRNMYINGETVLYLYAQWRRTAICADVPLASPLRLLCCKVRIPGLLLHDTRCGTLFDVTICSLNARIV